MRHMVQITVAVMVASLLAGVTLSANDNELRIRRRQVVVFNVMVNCEANPPTATITGTNFGSQPPHVTLALAPLVNVTSPTIAGVFQADLPAGFCENPGPGSYLLTVMRTRMRHRHRWLKHTKKDLALFEVAIGAATQADLASHASNPSAHHDPYTNDDASAVAQDLIDTHEGSLPHLSPAEAVGAVAAVGLAGVGFVDDVNDLIAAHEDDDDAHHEAGGGGGGGVEGYQVVTFMTPAGTSLDPGELADIPVSCPATKVPLGGGYEVSIAVQWFFDTGVTLYTSRPTVNGWLLQVRNNTNGAKDIARITVYAICAPVAAS